MKLTAEDLPHTADYAALRRGGYPDAGEQIGALVKAVAALQAGEPIPADAQAVIDEVQAVKDALPRPEPAS